MSDTSFQLKNFLSGGSPKCVTASNPNVVLSKNAQYFGVSFSVHSSFSTLQQVEFSWRKSSIFCYFRTCTWWWTNQI